MAVSTHKKKDRKKYEFDITIFKSGLFYTETSYFKNLFFYRLPFRGPDSNAESIPSFTPVSSWVNLDRERFKLCLDPSQLKKSPTNANSNEQTRRFQITCQLAVNSIVYCKTFFLPEDFVAFHCDSIHMEVHDALQPGMVRVTSAAVEKEFAQFVFSLLLEILDACLVSDEYLVLFNSKERQKSKFKKNLTLFLKQ